MQIWHRNCTASRAAATFRRLSGFLESQVVQIRDLPKSIRGYPMPSRLPLTSLALVVGFFQLSSGIGLAQALSQLCHPVLIPAAFRLASLATCVVRAAAIVATLPAVSVRASGAAKPPPLM